jgi:hypothetical protein
MAVEFDFIVFAHISIILRGVALGSAGRKDRFFARAASRSASTRRIRRNERSGHEKLGWWRCGGPTGQPQSGLLLRVHLRLCVSSDFRHYG